jgi:hypothetical protein
VERIFEPKRGPVRVSVGALHHDDHAQKDGERHENEDHGNRYMKVGKLAKGAATALMRAREFGCVRSGHNSE